MAAQDAIPPSSAIVPYGRDHIAAESGTSILAILVVLARRKGLIAACGVLSMLAAAAGLFAMRDSYTADAIILPPQQQQSSISALAAGALGNLAGSGLAAQLGLKNAADLYIGILKSQTISDAIVTQFHLQALYHAKLLSRARLNLRKHARFSSSKESLITISVDDHDPNRAAAMANAFVDELYKLNSQLAITDASQRRLFFEQRLRKEKDALTESEIELKNTQQSTGLLVPSGQAEVLIRSAAELRADIASREVALQAVRSYATDQNAQIQVLQREISTMQGQLAQIESNGERNARLEVPAGKLPDATLAYMRNFRDVKYHETLYELLAKQYEAAAIDEAKEAPVIQVIDRAKAPDRKSGPARGTLTLGAGLLGAMLSSLYVLVIHHLKTIAMDPAQAETFAALREAVRLRG